MNRRSLAGALVAAGILPVTAAAKPKRKRRDRGRDRTSCGAGYERNADVPLPVTPEVLVCYDPRDATIVFTPTRQYLYVTTCEGGTTVARTTENALQEISIVTLPSGKTRHCARQRTSRT